MMVLVDSSVLIAYLNRAVTPKAKILNTIVADGIPFGISIYTYQEVLQGARNEQDYKYLREYLNSQNVYSLPGEKATYEKAARLYFDLRRKGITIRGQTDILIALTAMENGFLLLHDDRDFDAIASKTDLAILDEF